MGIHGNTLGKHEEILMGAYVDYNIYIYVYIYKYINYINVCLSICVYIYIISLFLVVYGWTICLYLVLTSKAAPTKVDYSRYCFAACQPLSSTEVPRREVAPIA